MVFDAKLVTTCVFFLLESIALFLTVVGNGIVIYVMCSEKKIKRKSNVYILSVAVADLLVGLVAVPSGIAKVKILYNFP